MKDLKTSYSHTEALLQEPQNTLTRRFTEEERNALNKLRPMILEIHRIAYGGENPKTISLWGVTIDPLDPAANPRGSVVLMKFLRARKLDVDAAKTLLIEVLRWRQQVNIDDIMARQFPAENTPTRKFGKDKAGNVVIYNLLSTEHAKAILAERESDPKMVVERAACNLEKLARSLDYETTDRVTRVTDMAGLSFMDLADSKPDAALVRVTNDYYPDLSPSWFAVNAPFLLAATSWISSLFITPAGGTVQFVGKDTATIAKKLSGVIDPSELPEQFGGMATGFCWEVEGVIVPQGSLPETGAAVEKAVD